MILNMILTLTLTLGLEYSQGDQISYDLESIEQWVHNNVVHDSPLFQTFVPVFPFAGRHPNSKP